MTSQMLDILVNIAGCALAAVALLVVVKASLSCKLGAIPSVGCSTWLSACWAGIKFATNANEVLQQGYERHKSAPFKVAELARWVVVVSSRKHLEELCRAPDDVLSFMEAANERLHVEYTMGPEIHFNPYHIPIIRSQLTRNISALYPDIRTEIVMAFEDVLDLKGNEWKSVPALSSIQMVVCRTSNRVFVGLPLCHDPDWLELNIRYAFDVVKGGHIIGQFPDLLKPIVTRFCTNVNRNNKRGRQLLGPIIEERRKYLNESRWAGKPNDFLAWLMDVAEGPESTVECLTSRVLATNFVAIHTTSHSFTHALLYLATSPQYIKPLREEVEPIVEKEGWSKTALGQMRKIDSFLKECQRLEGISSLGPRRKAMKDFTFSGGTFVPKGTLIVSAARAIHHDESIYENAHAFEPFRFANLREGDGEGTKHQFVSTAPEYLPFGNGRQACPGRFFAASEMKSMLAHVVVTYDVRLAHWARRPRSLRIGTAVIPDPVARVMFRRRDG